MAQEPLDTTQYSKQERFSMQVSGGRRRAFWQALLYDFNVWTTKKRIEKLRSMHRNPAKRGLVETAEQWWWSRYRFYLLGELRPLRVNEG